MSCSIDLWVGVVSILVVRRASVFGHHGELVPGLCRRGPSEGESAEEKKPVNDLDRMSVSASWLQ